MNRGPWSRAARRQSWPSKSQRPSASAPKLGSSEVRHRAHGLGRVVRAFERWNLHAGALLAGVSGLIYGWLRYYGRVAGEFGPEPHPLQGLVQHLHVLTAPLLLFALGMTLRGHFASKLRQGHRDGRRSGLALALLILPMVAAGYLVQVAVGPVWRWVFAWVHGLTSLAFLAFYLGHALRAWQRPHAGIGRLGSRSLRPGGLRLDS